MDRSVRPRLLLLQSEDFQKFCGCGEKLLLLKANTAKNNGRFFWRCRNWTTEGNCSFFQWADEGEPVWDELTEKKDEETLCDKEKMVVDLLQKNVKLKKKLMEERKLGQIKMWLFLVSWAFTIVFCVLFVMKINCNM
ncbi:uncharacterized protein LOC114195394 [Vigna unguiculata]|uniref:uncharacterized protein LOC114195394 n=1 Tax=Vigna unguiculata TaxID=3917 RepID=UPI00101713F1|nr:uncharacterized protein LOC114195394 [Vigna unguiculata]